MRYNRAGAGTGNPAVKSAPKPTCTVSGAAVHFSRRNRHTPSDNVSRNTPARYTSTESRSMSSACRPPPYNVNHSGAAGQTLSAAVISDSVR